MKSLKKLLLTLTVSLAVIGAVYAFPHGPSGLHGKHGELLVELISAKLDLTAEQELRLQAVREKLQSLLPGNQEGRAGYQQQVLDLIATPTLDQQAVVNLIEEQHESRRAQLPEVVAVIAEFTDSLAAEQKQELVDLMQKRFSRVAMRH